LIPPQWVELGPIGYWRLSTILSALGLFLYVTFRTRRPWIGVLSTMAWASLYEIAWVLTNSMMHGTMWGGTIWTATAVVAWPVLAYIQRIKPNRLALVAFLSCWIVWVATGFHYNYPGQQNFVSGNEFLNVLTKVILAVAYAISDNTHQSKDEQEHGMRSDAVQAC